MINDVSASRAAGWPDSTHRFRSEPSSARQTSSASDGAISDELDLSPAAKSHSLLSASRLGKVFGPLVGDGGQVKIGNLQIAFEKGLGKFQQDLSALFAQHGISSNPPVVLQSNGEGKVLVAGDHPDKQRIEDLFEAEPELANRFRGLSSIASLLRAAERAQPFQDAYAKNPAEAVDQYGYLFDDNRQAVFNLEVSTKRVTTFFTQG